ncbi:MAG: IS4 family transposase [Bacteroidales bacterium]|jgi:hypothetical protein|nr:IS4 family transposase [Bacteroidales bacterium]MCI2121245.1 IS4 family transposase [Bacteroidales bacterium]MCI2146159.1 IS4 family transposase [Bacteroidales bacterium]
MNSGKYVFAQLIEFLPQKTFQRIVERYKGDKYVKFFSCWNQLLVMMYGQIAGCMSLRELVDILAAHSPKAYHLGLGKGEIKLSNLAKANGTRNCQIFEEFAYNMIDIARRKRIDTLFKLHGRFYAVDSTTIDLCLRDFWWAPFRKTKGGIKIHTVYDVVTQIPSYFNITAAKVHDMNFMDQIKYRPYAYYIFDKGYFDLARLYKINIMESLFIIRQRGHLQYKIVDGEEVLDGTEGIFRDQSIKLTGYQTKKKYPGTLRRIVYYAEDLERTFTFITNSFDIKAEDIALLYKNRWQVELFFKWIKQHLLIKSFWGNTENAVRIQIYAAICAYCLVAIVEHDCHLNRSTFEVLRVISASLLDKTPIPELFERIPVYDEEICKEEVVQLSFNF